MGSPGRPMRCSGRALFSLVLVATGLFAVVSAWRWPLKAALFPLAVGLPLVALAGVQLTTDPVGKAIMAIRSIPQAIGRAMAAPPGTPPDRLAVLREAFAKALRDPELKTEGDKAQIEFQHISHEAVLKDFSALLQQSPEVLKEMVKHIKFGG